MAGRKRIKSKVIYLYAIQCVTATKNMIIVADLTQKKKDEK